MKIYIDFDGVVLNTTPHIFDEWLDVNDDINIKELEKIEYIKGRNWHKILREASVIDDAISVLKDMDVKNTAILTKVHSLENEGTEKIRFLREMGVKLEVILVPYPLKKTEVVNASGNVLIDDTIHNLDDWSKCGGKCIFFNQNDFDVDEWHSLNLKYPKIKTLKNINTFIKKR